MVLPTLLKPEPGTRIAEADLHALSRTADLVLTQAREAALQIPAIGVTVLDLTPRAYPGEGTDWALLPVDADPTARDGLPMPRDVRRRLERIVAAGIEMDVLMIAHEVPKGCLPLHTPLTSAQLEKSITVPEPLKTAMTTEKVGAGIERTARAVGRAARAAGVGIGVAAGAAAVVPLALVAAPLMLLSGLDPVIVGGRTLHHSARPGEPVVWFELARWVW